MTNSEAMTIPEGYKQTEVGVIPEDWKVEAIKDAYDICNTLRLPLSSSVREGMQGKYPYYGPTKIQDYLNEYRVEGKYALIGEDGDHFLKYKVMPQTQLASGRFNVNNHAHLIKGRVNLTEWFYFYFKNRDISVYLTRQGAGRYKLSKGALEVLPCAVPSVSEQKEITSVLSDVDNLIAALETLIAKKSAIKTAAMQQLLTGKKRLPAFEGKSEGKSEKQSAGASDKMADNSGETQAEKPSSEFEALSNHNTDAANTNNQQTAPRPGYKHTELGEIPEDWEVVSYDESFKFLTTASNSRSDLSETDELSYIHYGDIHTLWNIKLDFSKSNLPKISQAKVGGAVPLRDGDLIMADASEDYAGIGKSIEIQGLGNTKAVSGLHTFLLRDKGYFVDGFRGYLHLIKAVKSNFDRLATGLKVYGLSKNSLREVLLPVPPKKEQTAIANVLSDMDTELDALQQRLAKTQAIKQGMMQELLTGKTRLINAC